MLLLAVPAEEDPWAAGPPYKREPRMTRRFADGREYVFCIPRDQKQRAGVRDLWSQEWRGWETTPQRERLAASCVPPVDLLT